MIIESFAGLALAVNVSIRPGDVTGPEPEAAPLVMSERRKIEIMRPLVRAATECVAQRVAADPRFGRSQVNELIVHAFESGTCSNAVRLLIEAHDRYYGPGSGERFFMGPYLDALPAAVTHLIGDRGSAETGR